MELVNKVLGDKQLFVSTIVLLVVIVGLVVYILRTKGREAVLTLIRKAEYLFDLRVKEKKNYNML